MTNPKSLEVLPPETKCDCLDCQEMCLHPCWPTPEEALVIELHHPYRMYRDYWVMAEGPDIYIFGPAIKGYCAKEAPYWIRGSCTFFVDGKCQLHDEGLKPLEGRLAHHSHNAKGIHEHMASLWNTELGRSVAEHLRRRYDLPSDD